MAPAHKVADLSPQARTDVPPERGELMIRATAMPGDTNPYGGVFGGWLMSQMALGAGALASREEAGKAVVVAASDFSFPGAMALGDELSVYCAITGRGRTSLTISATASGRERHGRAEVTVAEGRFRFVMLGGDGKPRALSSVAQSSLQPSASDTANQHGNS